MNIVFCIILLILIIIISTLTKSSFGGILQTTFKLGNSVVNSQTFPSITYNHFWSSGMDYCDLTNNSAKYVMNFPQDLSDKRYVFCKNNLYEGSPNGNINNNVKVSVYDLLTGDMCNLTNNVLGNLNMNNIHRVDPTTGAITDNNTLSVISNNNSITFEQNENGTYIILIGLETQVPVSAWQPTVYLYKTSSFRQQTCSIPNPTDSVNCMSIPGSNIIDNQSCENCQINLQLNGVVPDQLKIALNNFNVPGMFPGTDGMYAEPQLFINNSSINGYINYQDLIKFLSDKIMFTRGADFIKRIDVVPDDDKNNKYFVVYYTTLDNSLNYVSDSAIILNGPGIYGPYTINDGNKFSNRHIKLTGGNCKNTYECAYTDMYFGLDIILPNGKISIGGKNGDLQDRDFGYLYPFAFIPNCQIIFSISTRGSGYGSGNEKFPLNNCLTKNLSSINLSYEYNPDATGVINTHYMKAYADLFDTSGNNILSKSSGHSNNTDTSGCS